MDWNPENASTPNIVPRLICRPPITQSESNYSPIQLAYHNMNNSETQESVNPNDGSEDVPDISDDKSCGELSTSASNDFSSSGEGANIDIKREYANDISVHKAHSHSDTVESSETKTPNYINNSVLGTLGILMLATAVYYLRFGITIVDNKVITIHTLQKSFPQQDNQFWAFIESGVSEIVNFEKPSVIVLMYNNKVSSQVDNLVDSITEYASCILNSDCYVKPISLIGKDLNTDETTKDYGILIDRYGSLLEEKHIMVVKNIEEISGTVAQAFHSFCDEYTPLVKKSLFLFTIRVDEYYGKALQQTIDVLQTQWNDIHRDKLEALITRVSSIVLQIK